MSAFTSDPTIAPLFRVHIEPSAVNGLDIASRLMVDTVMAVPKAKLGRRIGRLSDADMVRVNRALLVFSASRDEGSSRDSNDVYRARARASDSAA